MCFDVKSRLIAQLKRAKHRGDTELIGDLNEKIKEWELVDYYHISGFSHPRLLIYTDTDPYMPLPATWGLVPFWVKSEDQKNRIWNSTLNARGETIFEKPAFRSSAESKRCLIYVDGFYEHHHFNGKTYPFYIQRYDGEPFAIAGLWSSWRDTGGILLNTFTIVTTVGNSMMSEIHNNPKMQGPRMPVILGEEKTGLWLQPIKTPLDKRMIENLLQPLPDKELKAHTVRQLRGKYASGNSPQASEEYFYPDLEMR